MLAAVASRRSSSARLAVPFLALLGALAIFWIPGPRTWSGDATVYELWMQRIAAEGILVFPDLGRDFLQNYQGFPAPTRWGWLLLVGGIRRWFLFDAEPYRVQVLVAWSSAVLMVPVILLWLRRKAAPAVLLAGAALLVAAPLLHGMSQYAYPDTLHALSSFVLFWLISAWFEKGRYFLLPLMAMATLAIVSTREIGIYVVSGVGLLFTEHFLHSPPPSMSPRVLLRWAACPFVLLPFLAMLLGCALAVLGGVILLGGPELYWQVVEGYVQATLNEPVYAPQVMNGPYYRYLIDLLLVSPAAVTVALLALVSLWRDAEFAPLMRRILPVLLIAFLGYSCFAKTLRYVIVIDCLLRLLAACAVILLWRKRPLVAGLLLLVMLGHDLYCYEKLWAHAQVYDPVTNELARALKMIRH